MQLVFEQLFGGEGAPETLVELTDYEPGEEDRRYIEAVAGGVREHAREIDETIAPCLRGWTLDRLSRVDLAILRLSVYEMRYAGLAAGVSITEALRLARKFSAEESCPFINGVLGTISRAQAAQA